MLILDIGSAEGHFLICTLCKCISMKEFFFFFFKAFFISIACDCLLYDIILNHGVKIGLISGTNLSFLVLLCCFRRGFFFFSVLSWFSVACISSAHTFRQRDSKSRGDLGHLVWAPMFPAGSVRGTAVVSSWCEAERSNQRGEANMIFYTFRRGIYVLHGSSDTHGLWEGDERERLNVTCIREIGT